VDGSIPLRLRATLAAMPGDLVERYGEPLDRVAEVLAAPARSLGPGPLKDLLSGTWLGHPLHPMLTDVTIGAWTASSALDVLGGERGREGAEALVGLGVLAALPTAVTGWSDWSDLGPRERRIGVAHALTNLTATAAYAASWVARRRGHRSVGLLLAAVGAGVASAGAYLGGHLVYVRGVGVDATAFERLPFRYAPAIAEDDLAEDQPAVAQVGGVAVFLCRRGGDVHALHDRCTHLGGPLHEGSVEDGSIVCPWHGSRFRMQDGALERGPARTPQPALRSRIRDGSVEVARPVDG
jgi:nitrite reductase/ring-hydroxylating ferredoxin subunit/uncharacterized membrane protein